MDTINQHQTAAGTPVEPSNHPSVRNVWGETGMIMSNTCLNSTSR
jgi:hypothetical protein